MKKIYCLIVVLLICAMLNEVHAKDTFPDFTMSAIRLYIPIHQLRGVHEDLQHEVGFNLSYNIRGQVFSEPVNGHIQTITEGFSGISNRSTPWETLTELLAAYHNADIQAVRELYTDDSQNDIGSFLSDPELLQRFQEFMQNIVEMHILLGFEYKEGLLALTRIDYGVTDPHGRKNVTPFYFVKSGEEYFLSSVNLTEPIDSNIASYLQEYSITELIAPKHNLSIEKQGNGNGIIKGSGIDCGEDCVEVFVEGTTIWLKAEPDEYSTFDGWLVDSEPLNGRLVMQEDKIVTAVLTKIPPKEYTLTVEQQGTGEGMVTDNETACESEDCLTLFSLFAGEEESTIVQNGIDCGDTCSVTYNEGTTVYLQAVAIEGSEFVEWQVNGEPVTEPLEMTQDLTIVAIFDTVELPEDQSQEPQP